MNRMAIVRSGNRDDTTVTSIDDWFCRRALRLTGSLACVCDGVKRVGHLSYSLGDIVVLLFSPRLFLEKSGIITVEDGCQSICSSAVDLSANARTWLFMI
jgi:hypothetical protein